MTADVDLGEFKRLLANGHGRAILWLRQGCTPDLREAVFRAVVAVQQYDPQLEDDRDCYLKFAVDSLDDPGQVLERVAVEAIRSRNSRRQSQMLDFLALYCMERPHLAETVGQVARRNLRSGNPRGVYAWLRAQPERALRYLLRHWAPTQEQLGRVSSWLDVALEGLGKRRVRTILGRYSGPARDAFLRELLGEDDGAVRPPAKRPPPLPAVLEFIQSGRIPRSTDLHNLSEQDIQLLVAHQPEWSQPDQLAAWLFAFVYHPFPGSVEALGACLRHDNYDVRYRALQALAEQKGQQARRLCLPLVRQVHRGGVALGTLARNYVPGDEALLERELRRPRHPVARHHVVMAVIETLEAHVVSNEAELWRLIYDLVECETCRCTAFHRLLELDSSSTSDLVDEGQWDSNHFIRETAAKAQRSTCEKRERARAL